MLNSLIVISHPTFPKPYRIQKWGKNSKILFEKLSCAIKNEVKFISIYFQACVFYFQVWLGLTAPAASWGSWATPFIERNTFLTPPPHLIKMKDFWPGVSITWPLVSDYLFLTTCYDYLFCFDQVTLTCFADCRNVDWRLGLMVLRDHQYIECWFSELPEPVTSDGLIIDVVYGQDWWV